ncbi:MAG: hypothetical protein ACI9MU_000454 [Alphaproteobacteria bacterium]|jgi:hypothetical protein
MHETLLAQDNDGPTSDPRPKKTNCEIPGDERKEQKKKEKNTAPILLATFGKIAPVMIAVGIAAATHTKAGILET